MYVSISTVCKISKKDSVHAHPFHYLLFQNILKGKKLARGFHSLHIRNNLDPSCFQPSTDLSSSLGRQTFRRRLEPVDPRPVRSATEGRTKFVRKISFTSKDRKSLDVDRLEIEKCLEIAWEIADFNSDLFLVNHSKSNKNKNVK